MQVATKAIVFSAIKYAEADLIVTCFTEKYGLKTYLLRGVLKSKKGKLRVSLFQPLTLLDINAFHKNKGTLERLNEVKISTPYKTLHTDLVKSSLVFFLSEILKNSIQEEEANPSLFNFLEGSFIWLDLHKEVANFHLLFLLKLTSFLGFYPDFSEKNGSYFNLLEGNFQNTIQGDFCENGEKVQVLKKLSTLTYEDLPLIIIPRKDRQQTLLLLLNYYKLHIQGYKTPKSLSVFSEMY